MRVKFTGNCLKQDKVTFNYKNVVNIHIVYELNKIAAIGNNFPTLQNVLFGAVKFKMLILISIGIRVMELDLIESQAFHF